MTFDDATGLPAEEVGGIVNFLEACTGYACPPGNKVPAGDVIVRTVHDTLATTGSDPSLLIGGIITAVLFMLGGGILFAYNHLRNKERKK